MKKVGVFIGELDMIQDEMLRDFAEYCLVRLPEYFFTAPASSTGKFHPSYTLGEGGLVRHTKAAVKIANDLLSLEQNKHLDSDAIIFALLFHDGIKKGIEETKYTITEHPLLAADFIVGNLEDYLYDNQYHDRVEEQFELTSRVMDAVRMIKSHMGQWNYDYRTKKEVMPKPIQEDEKMVHTCDYLASRKYLTCEVE